MKSLALTLSIFLHVALFGMALYMSRGAHVRVDLNVPVYNVDLVSLGRPAPAPKVPAAPAEQPKAPEAPKATPAPEDKAVDIKELPAPQPKPEAKTASEVKPEAKPEAKPKPKQPDATEISPKKTAKAAPKPKPKEPTAEEILAEALKAAKTNASKRPQPSPQEVLKRELAALKKEVGSSPAAAAADGNVGASTGQQVYAQDAVARIRPNWRYPLAGTNQDLSAAVEMNLTADGTITNYKLVKPSGRADFDASVLKAVDETKKLSPPPANMRTIQITFHLQDLRG